MGERANVVFKEIRFNKMIVSPVVYLHWQGEEVLKLLNKTKIQMKDRTYAEDVSARFVQRASNELTDLQYSIAINNSEDILSNPYPWADEDNGVWIVDLPNWNIRHIIKTINEETRTWDKYKFTDYVYRGFITGWEISNVFYQDQEEVKIHQELLKGLGEEIKEQEEME